MRNRIIALLLTVMMLTVLMPMTAFALEGGASLTIVNKATYGGSLASGVTMDYNVTIAGVSYPLSLAADDSYTYTGLPDGAAYSVTQLAYDNPSYAPAPAEGPREGTLESFYQYEEDGSVDPGTHVIDATQYAAAIGLGNSGDVVGYYDGGVWKTDQVISKYLLSTIDVVHSPDVFAEVTGPLFETVTVKQWVIYRYVYTDYIKATYTYDNTSYSYQNSGLAIGTGDIQKEAAAYAAFGELKDELQSQYFCEYTNKDTVVNLYQRVTPVTRTYSFSSANATETFATALEDAPAGTIKVNYAVFDGAVPSSNDSAKFQLFKDDDTLVGTAAQTSITIPLTSYGYTENKFSGVPEGSYYIKQSEAPEGYELDEAEYPVAVNRDGSVSGSGFHDGVLYNKTMSALGQTLYLFINSETVSLIQASISLPAAVSGSFSDDMTDLTDAIRTAVIDAIDTQNSILPASPAYTVEYKNSLGLWTSLDGLYGIGAIGKGTHEIRVTLEESATHTSAQANTSVTVGSKGTISVNYAKVEYTTIEGTQVPIPNYLEGSEFALFNEDGTSAGITASKSQRSISQYGYEENKFSGLAAGNYYIKQTVAPDGYKVDTKEYHFTVNEMGEISAPQGEDYIKSYMSAYAVEKFEYLSIPLFDNEKVQTTEGLYRNAPDSYTIGLPIDASGKIMLDDLKAAIFDAVVNTNYSEVDEFGDIIKSIDNLSVSDVLIMVDFTTIGIYSEINMLIGEGTYDAKIALIDAQDYYPNEITFELVLSDNRIAAQIVLSEIDDIVYSENLSADIKAAVEAAVDASSVLPENPVFSIEHNIGTDDIPIWVSIDNTSTPLNVGTHNVRVRSEATITHTAGETFADITIVPGQANIEVNFTSINYGESIPSSLVVTDPASLKTAVIYAGIDIGADPYVSIVLPDNLNILNDPVLWGLKQLLDLQQVSVGELEDTLLAVGVPEDVLGMIFDNIPEGIKDIRVNSSAPTDAGAYLVVAVNVDKNYEALPAFGILTILMDTEGHELKWNQDVENYFINVSLELDTFDFSASYFVDDVEDTQREVKYKFFGVGRDGAEYSETPPTDIGAYTQVAYVDIDNEFAYPIVRAFVVGEDVADIDVACESILVGEPMPQMVTTDPADLDTLTIYAGVNDNADAYIGIVYPEDNDSLIGDMIFDKLNDMDADTLKSLLISIGISEETVTNLFAMIPSNAGSVTVTKSAPDTGIAGAYIVGAMVIEEGYLPAMGIGALAVRKLSDDVELSWNEEISGYFIKNTEIGGFDFSATCYVEGQESDATVNYKYLRAGQNGFDFTETPPTDTGVYTQIAYIMEDDIITLPIMRTFAIVDEDADVDVACESILVGDALPNMVTTDPAGLDTITIYAGVNDNAEAYIGVVYPGDADSLIGDIIFDKLNGMNVDELRELLENIGIPTETINNLFSMLPQNVGTVTITRSAPDTSVAGVYIVGAMVIEDGYVPAMGLGALAVKKQSEDVELRWNEGIGYFINSLDVDDVDYSAACYVEGEESDAVVKYKFFGVGQNGADFTSSHPTVPGVYTQIAYIIEDDIITLPIFRTYAVVDECADIDVACESILVGEPLPNMVTTDPAGLDTLTIYAGIDKNADAFIGIVYPSDADSMIGDIIFDKLNSINVDELKELLEDIGVPADKINDLFAMLPSNIGSLTITNSAPDTGVAGAYLVGAMVIEDGYLPVMDIGALAVLEEQPEIELTWNQEIDNGEIPEHIIARDEFDFGATAKVDGVEAEGVQHYFIGITTGNEAYHSSVNPTVPGVYAQLAVFSNNDCSGIALLRSFTITPSTYYTVTVSSGTGDGTYVEGDVVTITADAPAQYMEFKEWIVNSGGVTFDDTTSDTTTFIMPAGDVTVEATYKEQDYLLGDADQDGDVDIFDMLAIERHIWDIEALTGLGLRAADADQDGDVDIFDMLAIERHIWDIELLF